jgi:hypothetical protein
MPGFLSTAFGGGRAVAPGEILARLIVALVLGGVVAWTYRRTRAASEISTSFATTLVLLCILIAMVTQVIGDNIARAFSLVGALSIVRFRTVVRDTRDTAYVIFSVVVGMAVGANDPWVAGIGILVVVLAAFLLKRGVAAGRGPLPTFELRLRVGLGFDFDAIIGRLLDEWLVSRQLLSIGTVKQGTMLSVVYEARLLPERSPADLLQALRRVDGVQSVDLRRRTAALET